MSISNKNGKAFDFIFISLTKISCHSENREAATLAPDASAGENLLIVRETLPGTDQPGRCRSAQGDIIWTEQL